MHNHKFPNSLEIKLLVFPFFENISELNISELQLIILRKSINSDYPQVSYDQFLN